MAGDRKPSVRVGGVETSPVRYHEQTGCTQSGRLTGVPSPRLWPHATIWVDCVGTMLDFRRDAKEARMSKVESLEQEILKLSPQEMAELRTWFLEHDAELWDRQIEEDARTGRLDRLAKKALESYHAGKHTEL